MAEAKGKKAAADAAAGDDQDAGNTPSDPEPTQEGAAEGLTRIKVRLGGDKQAKLFTTCGPAVNGSVIDLPTAEARRFCDLELALPTMAEVNVIAPKCYIENNKYIGPPDAA